MPLTSHSGMGLAQLTKTTVPQTARSSPYSRPSFPNGFVPMHCSCVSLTWEFTYGGYVTHTRSTLLTIEKRQHGSWWISCCLGGESDKFLASFVRLFYVGVFLGSTKLMGISSLQEGACILVATNSQ